MFGPNVSTVRESSDCVNIGLTAGLGPRRKLATASKADCYSFQRAEELPSVDRGYSPSQRHAPTLVVARLHRAYLDIKRRENAGSPCTCLYRLPEVVSFRKCFQGQERGRERAFYVPRLAVDHLEKHTSHSSLADQSIRPPVLTLQMEASGLGSKTFQILHVGRAR